MSNLLKQYNVIQTQDNVRVIDYNEMVSEKIAEQNKKRLFGAGIETTEASDGFVSGLVAEEVEIAEEPSQETAEEILEKAREEAEQLVRDAQMRADELLNSANAQAEELRQKARQEGHKEGYADGERSARTELETEYDKKEEELNQLRLQVQTDYNQEMKELEPKLLNVIIQVVEKVFHIQFDDKTEILLYLIQNAILNIEGSRTFHVRVGDEQRLFLEKHKEEILDRVGHDITLNILSDALLEGNQCVIETETGVFDCSLGVQLENLIKDLRSLSS